MRRRRASPEAGIHRALHEHLRLRGKPGLVFFHVPNEGKRSARQGAELKRQGMIAGVADWIFLHAAKFFALEVKADHTRKPTEAQLAFLAAVNEAGGYAACTHGLDRALAVIEGWGLLRGMS